MRGLHLPIVLLAACCFLPMGLIIVPIWCWLPFVGLLLIGWVRNRAISETEQGLAELEDYVNKGEK